MLKRFMTWLLRRLQGLMGALNTKRGTSQQPTQDYREDTARTSQRSDRPQTATSRSTVPLVDHLSQKPSAKPDNAPANSLSDASISESDTHRRLDAAASAPPSTETVMPSFPNNVSELLSSPQADVRSPKPEENITPATSVRSLKKVPDSQLPGIHDLLPAVESANLNEPEAPESADPVISKMPDSAEEELTAIESDPAAISDSTVEQPSALDQAVLFSFDITEQSADIRGDELLAEEPRGDEATSDKSVGEELASLNTTDDEPVTAADSTGEISIEVPSVDDSAENLLGAKAETLPYPWALPVPEVEQKNTQGTQPLQVDQFNQSAAVKPEPVVESASAIAQHNRPVKNGVVKLLFTLKEGNFHGYIAPDDGSKDILFHQKYINADIFAHLERGVPVTVSIKYIEGKAYATRVDLLNG